MNTIRAAVIAHFRARGLTMTAGYAATCTDLEIMRYAAAHWDALGLTVTLAPARPRT